MAEITFHKWLRKEGRAEEVADRVIRLVTVYADFLKSETDITLDSAEPGNLESFVEFIERREKPPAGEHYHPGAKSHLWAIRYYYRYTENQEMAGYAGMLREARIKRKPFRLRDFRGVDPEQIAALKAVGIKHINQMLKAGKTPEMRRKLAEDTALPLEVITELVKLSDLARIPGIKSIRARLYHDAGVDTIEKMAGWEPGALKEMLAEFVNRTNFDGIAPLPAEVLFSVSTAQKLPQIVVYD